MMTLKTNLKKSLSLLLCIMLIAAMALFTTGCGDKKQGESDTTIQTESVTADSVTDDSSVLGEGALSFTFSVTDVNGETMTYEIHTDETTVGTALSQLGLIDGTPGDYGLYVTTVNGITLDYDTDGKYWAFYIDGEYASSGVDTTEISEGAHYELKAE